MRSCQWLAVLAVGIMIALFGVAREGQASSTSDDTSPIEAVIGLARGEALLGESVVWRVSMTPRSPVISGVIELRPSDPSAWYWPSGNVMTTLAMSTTTTLAIVAVPLQPGTITPGIELLYSTQEGPQVQSVMAPLALSVVSPESLVVSTILPHSATAIEGGMWSATILLENSSPFTLDDVRLSALGADLQWGSLPSATQILPWQTISRPITATVIGQHAQPQILLEYTWHDAAQQPHQRTVGLSGPVVVLREERLSWLYTNVGSAMIGFVLGFTGAFLQTWVNSKRDRARQHEIDRDHVFSLLDLTVLQAKQAMLATRRVDLEPLQKLYLGEAGLYTILHEERLAESVVALYKAASDYNDGLDRPGGAQRLFELRHANEALAKVLRSALARHTKSSPVTPLDDSEFDDGTPEVS
jgi:hypothetical protein